MCTNIVTECHIETQCTSELFADDVIGRLVSGVFSMQLMSQTGVGYLLPSSAERSRACEGSSTMDSLVHPG